MGISAYNKEKNAALLERVSALEQAAINLYAEWTDCDTTEKQESALETNYPFCESFDEMVAKIQAWKMSVSAEFQKVSA